MQPETIIRILTDVTGFLPSAKPLHDLLVAHAAEAAKLIPVVQNLGEAPSALEAAEKAAPNLTAAIKGLVAVSIPRQSPGVHDAPKTAENFVRSLGGIGRMTPAQEAAWMDRMTPTGSG